MSITFVRVYCFCWNYFDWKHFLLFSNVLFFTLFLFPLVLFSSHLPETSSFDYDPMWKRKCWLTLIDQWIKYVFGYTFICHFLTRDLSVKTIYKIFMGNNDKVQVYEDQTGNKTMHKKKIDIFNVFFWCKIFNVF